MAAVIKEGPCSEHIRLSQVPVLHLSTFYTYSRAAQAGVACRCLLSRIVLLPTGNTRCRKFPFIAEGMAVFGGCLSQKGSPPSPFLSDESSARGARPGISEMAFPDPVVTLKSLSDFGLSSSSQQIVNDSNALHQQMLNLPISLSRKGEEIDLFTLPGWQRTEANSKKEQHIL